MASSENQESAPDRPLGRKSLDSTLADHGEELFECVPNFSFGRDEGLLAELVEVADAVEGVSVLDYSLDADHNRAVLTFAGTSAGVAEAAFRLVEAAALQIDLTKHSGVHPRIGATDVLPIIPLRSEHRDLAIDLAHGVGARIGRDLGIPVYFYGSAARTAARRALPDVRRGGFEALRKAIGTDSARRPDEGPTDAIHPTAGATAVGVRPFLVALNIDLETEDVGVARGIAAKIREAGGGLPGLRALGLFLDSRGVAQVSMNVTDHARLSLVEIFEAVRDLAKEQGVDVRGSELIGLAPAAALNETIAAAIRLRGFDSEQQVLEARLLSVSTTGTKR
ncbi:MAG: glutamate formiminotransferase [Planctomycetota bacterium]|jgi:glutamate formiminotransferase